MEETIHIQRRENDPNLKHIVKFAHLFYVFFYFFDKFMSLLSMPSSVRQRLEHIQMNFLWGGGNLEWKPHLVRWELVCLSKKKGGLEVKCLSTLNNALLGKWNWRFANKRGALWNQVI